MCWACSQIVYHILACACSHAAVSDMPAGTVVSVVLQRFYCSQALQKDWQLLTLVIVVQEAAAAGVKVVDAKRILKLMQALEAVLNHNATDGSLQYQSLRTRIEAAEQVNLKTLPFLA